MRRSTRPALVGVVALLTVALWAPLAHAVGNSDAAKRAAQYVATQSGQASDAGAAADSLLALAAGGDAALSPQATQLLATMTSGAPAYAATAPEAAAKLVVASVAVGVDPTTMGGVNLVEAVKAGARPDGSFGSAPGARSSAWGLVALSRAGQQVPSAMLAYLVKLANSDGGFGKLPGDASDAESTGLALQALSTQTDSISARDATDKAVAWATAQQQADGSWAGSNPVTATSLLGAGLQSAGRAQPKAVQYLVTQQLSSGALPSSGAADLAATQQATFLLGDTSYASVRAPGLVTATVPPSATEQPTATASTATQSASPAPSPTPAPAPAPGDGNNILWILLPIVLIALLAAACYYLFIRPNRLPKQGADAAGGPASPATAGAPSPGASAATSTTAPSASPGATRSTPGATTAPPDGAEESGAASDTH